MEGLQVNLNVVQKRIEKKKYKWKRVEKKENGEFVSLVLM